MSCAWAEKGGGAGEASRVGAVVVSNVPGNVLLKNAEREIWIAVGENGPFLGEICPFLGENGPFLEENGPFLGESGPCVAETGGEVSGPSVVVENALEVIVVAASVAAGNIACYYLSDGGDWIGGGCPSQPSVQNCP